MPDDQVGMPSTDAFRRWLESLKTRDAALYAELTGRLKELQQNESTLESAEAGGSDAMDLVLETIVRDGRPALPVKNDRIEAADGTFDAAAKEIVSRLTAAAGTINPLIPLVGRIDVENYPGSLQYAGTGWLVEEDMVVTNRHVASLIAQQQGGTYVFLPGRFGESMRVSIDYKHELDSKASAPAKVLRVIWIQPDAKGPDVALLQVARRTDGVTPKKFTLSANDAAANEHVAVIGYPARAPKEVIPDQKRMDQIYSGAYDIKRIAPGLTGPASAQGWSTHDCTTLGGNSGSVVVSLTSGQAVALHFAGLYLIENYAVPASRLLRILRDQPWRAAAEVASPADAPTQPPPPSPAPISVSAGEQSVVATSATGEVTVTVPLTIRISLGQPLTAVAGNAVDGAANADDSAAVREAARALLEKLRGGGVVAVHAGYVIEKGLVTDTDCLVVAAHPERMDDVRARAPQRFAGYLVEVRPASIKDQTGEGALDINEAATSSISYDDANRVGNGFSFDWVEEPMDVTLHVGPERGWSVLSEFLSKGKELVSSIYEFHASHIADALEGRLDDGAKLTLVMAQQSRDPEDGELGASDFSRRETFAKWAERFKKRFRPVFVPIGASGLVAMSYHIKVTVRDAAAFWLSSGNWKQTSQPNIDDADLDDPKKMTAFNREWHVVMENATIAERFRNHILTDYQTSFELGGTPEAVGTELMVDVPESVLEGVVAEAVAPRVVEPLVLSRRVRVKPLLTPDRKGKVYTDAVLELIRSAKRQILFQNQYIKVTEFSSGFFEKLVEALIKKSKQLKDVRIIVRSENDGFWDEVSELKRRGMDVNRCVRRLPKTHTKGIIVDGERVLVGSHNWSQLGVTLNRDASLLFDDVEIAEYYRDVFEMDWRRANDIVLEESVSDAAPRIADLSSPPPRGYRRMPLSEYLEG